MNEEAITFKATLATSGDPLKLRPHGDWRLILDITADETESIVRARRLINKVFYVTLIEEGAVRWEE